MSGLKPEERAAADILRRALPADDIEPRDVPDAPDGTHDFDAIAGSRRIAVEVTQATDPASMEQADAIEPSTISATASTGRWLLYLRADARVDRLRPRLDSMVAAVEADGIWRIQRGRGGVAAWSEHKSILVPTPESAEQLGVAGVEKALRLHGSPYKRIYLQTRMLGGFPKVDAPAATVERLSLKKLKTLQSGDAADADERHLFVWAIVFDFETFSGIEDELIADARPPHVPEGIDTVWIARFDGTDRPTLWRCDRGGRWISC